jgi:hypothetical protein
MRPITSVQADRLKRERYTLRSPKITFSTRRGERVYSRKCAFHALLISSASYTERALYLAPANDGQAAVSSK